MMSPNGKRVFPNQLGGNRNERKEIPSRMDRHRPCDSGRCSVRRILRQAERKHEQHVLACFLAAHRRRCAGSCHGAVQETALRFVSACGLQSDRVCIVNLRVLPLYLRCICRHRLNLGSSFLPRDRSSSGVSDRKCSRRDEEPAIQGFCPEDCSFGMRKSSGCAARRRRDCERKRSSDLRLLKDSDFR